MSKKREIILMNSIKCSIITVCYNSEKTISRTIESVLNQTYGNIEYIIVDGGSLDSTVAIIKEYEIKFKGRLRWVSEKDDGIYFAMNKGIKMTTGQLIGIINSDDYYEKNAVEIAVKNIGKESYQILYGMVRSFQNDLEDSIAIYSHNFLHNRMIGHPACFVTRETYMDFGMYNTKYISAADYDFMLRMNDNDLVHFKPIYKLIANFSLGGMCSTSKAYLDLIKMKRDHGMLSSYEYYKQKLKCNIYDAIHKK